MRGHNFTNVAMVTLLLHIAAFTFTSCKTDIVKWKTLDGSAPLVIARGGLSGVFPDSSSDAYSMAKMASVPDLVLWCDVQLTKDQAGICLPSIMLNNCSNVNDVYENRSNSYIIDGVQTKGYFPIDFTLKELQQVSVTQELISRSSDFDGNYQILTVEVVFAQNKPAGYWLNIQHDAFYSQHKLRMKSYVISASKQVIISHISSPDIQFLQGLAKPFASTKTKLVLRFLEQDLKETSTSQTYGSLLKNLTYIKSFASGILVPKTYIWPVDATSYLLPHTSLVVDAHKVGLQVFAANFANDNTIAYNYSYNPVAEYLSFIDNSDFSVDGVLSDFPVTSSVARDCFAHVASNASTQANLLVISHCGASGDYPGCTDVSYTTAISDGADIIDCPVQMSKDSVPFCSSSANLINSTLVLQTQFRNMLTTVEEIQSDQGIFSFDLNWADIQGLTPAILSPFRDGFSMYRNPKFSNAGKLVSLSEFLDLAKNASSLSGVLIMIENAKYLAEHKSMSIIDAVLDTLEKADYNSTAKKVMIQSTNSSVLKVLKGKKYELVYEVDETIRGITNDTITDIKTFSDSVAVNKKSVFPTNQGFLLSLTDVVQQLQSFNLSVYVNALRNEFVDIPYDFFSEPVAEINSYVTGARIDGLITEFPQTVASYKKNLCLKMKDRPIFMNPVQTGQLISLVTPELMPPAEAPNPLLIDADVSEAPLPAHNTSSGTAETPQRSSNGHHQITASTLLSCLAIIVPVCLLL